MTTSDRFSANTQAMVEAAMTNPGDTDPALRHAIAAHASELGGYPLDISSEISTELQTYVKKVALYAYKITDEDVAALGEAGYSEDAIFEITVSAALGVGMVRLECGLAALEGES
jgi:alkylhydroperoxidase family enzyme